MITTERAPFDFRVKQFPSGAPWIVAEQISGDMPSLRGLLGFDLEPGTTLQEAGELASHMRKHIRGLSLSP